MGPVEYCGSSEEVTGPVPDSIFATATSPGSFQLAGQFHIVIFALSCAQGVALANSNPAVGQILHTFYASNHEPAVVGIGMSRAGTDTLTATRADGTKTTVTITYP
jgi:hypothetical protein